MNETSREKCYGLALSDSADLGPYQAGVLIGLVQHLSSEDIAYKSVSGVALGAINAYILSRYAVGEEANAAKRLSKPVRNNLFLGKFWQDLADKQLYEEWSAGYVYGMYF